MLCYHGNQLLRKKKLGHSHATTSDMGMNQVPVQEHIRIGTLSLLYVNYSNYLSIGGVNVEEPWMEGASPFVGELTHPRASTHTLE